MEYKEVIKIVNNFLSEDEMKFFKNYNDYILEHKKDYLVTFNKGNRPVLQFGRDLCHDHSSHQSLNIVSDIENDIRKLFIKVQNKTKELFNDSSEIYVCSFWFAKQFPGAFVTEHDDTDDGLNMHFKYSAVIYLNDLKNTGQLVFTDLNYSYKPKAGDIVIFKSIDGGKHLVDPINEERYTLPMWMTEDISFAI